MDNPNKLDENSKQYKRKLKESDPSKARRETLRKVAIARSLAEQNCSIERIQNEIGYKTKQSVLALMRLHNIPIPEKVSTSKFVREDHWFQGTADPSGLTPYELERCKKLDIKPERWAWLKLCPSSGNATKYDWIEKFFGGGMSRR